MKKHMQIGAVRKITEVGDRTWHGGWNSKISQRQAYGQDGRVGKRGTRILPGPHQNYN